MLVVRRVVAGIDMLYSGIDLHKHSLVIHTVAEDGTRVREAELATSHPRALTAYFATTAPRLHRAVVECLGSWYWVRDRLRPRQVQRLVIQQANTARAQCV